MKRYSAFAEQEGFVDDCDGIKCYCDICEDTFEGEYQTHYEKFHEEDGN